MFRLAGGGFGDIPTEKAASALVTAVPTRQRPVAWRRVVDMGPARV